jgi:effector-binding domain-containing protein
MATNLNETPESIVWPVTHYVYVEKAGPFQQTAQTAWGELRAAVPALTTQVTPLTFMSLYKIKPEMIYRAGVGVSSEPKNLPAGLSYQKFSGGKYMRFVLKGSYRQLPEACGRVFEIVEATKIPVSQNWFIENYVKDPMVTPEADLVTEILVPTM